ncbi:hypothetical protein [Enterobacteria phage vB_EcoM_IME540]|nr:hypothetical protein [Enterobacteria phage vB_EcoM_IME540]
MYSVIGLKLVYNMKAYLETVVIGYKEGGDVSTAVSQIVLEFENEIAFADFKDNFDRYEKGPKFEVYRTLLVL